MNTKIDASVEKLCDSVRDARDIFMRGSMKIIEFKDGQDLSVRESLSTQDIEQLKQEAEDAKQAACDYLDWVCSLTPTP